MGRCFISSQARAPKECNTTDLSLPSLGWGKWEPASYGMFPGVSLNPLIGPFSRQFSAMQSNPARGSGLTWEPRTANYNTQLPPPWHWVSSFRWQLAFNLFAQPSQPSLIYHLPPWQSIRLHYLHKDGRHPYSKQAPLRNRYRRQPGRCHLAQQHRQPHPDQECGHYRWRRKWLPCRSPAQGRLWPVRHCGGERSSSCTCPCTPSKPTTTAC